MSGRALLVGLVAVAVTGCDLYIDGDDGRLTEDEFWDQVAGADRCGSDAACTIVYAPCDPCATSINVGFAPEFEELATRVDCQLVDRECPLAEYPLCENSHCVMSEEPRPQPEPPGGEECNPVANTGCVAGEKCTYVVTSFDPFLGYTGCAPAGDVPDGGACAVDSTTGVDDCAGGLYCLDGVCTEICGTTPETCPAGEVCGQELPLFDDAYATGLCRPACDPIAAETGCAEGEGCYLSIASGRGFCDADCRADPDCAAGNGAPTGWPNACSAAWGTQNCRCEYLDACAPGYGCMLLDDPAAPTGLVCAGFCDPTGSGGPSCADSTVPDGSCRQISTFYSDTGNVPPQIGMCVPGDRFPCFGCVDPAQPGCASCP